MFKLHALIPPSKEMHSDINPLGATVLITVHPVRAWSVLPGGTQVWKSNELEFFMDEVASDCVLPGGTPVWVSNELRRSFSWMKLHLIVSFQEGRQSG
jgi:hypothetical protein